MSAEAENHKGIDVDWSDLLTYFSKFDETSAAKVKSGLEEMQPKAMKPPDLLSKSC